MVRALRVIGIAAAVAAQVPLLLVAQRWAGADYLGYQAVVGGVTHGVSPYAVTLDLGPDSVLTARAGFFRWSALAVPLLVPVVAMGLGAWQALHLAALALLRDRRLLAVTALSFPFWMDVSAGSLFFLAFVAAARALQGSRVAAAAYLSLLLLMPRPLMLPVAAWLLWQRPRWALPLLAAAIAQAAVLAAIGELVPWLRVLADSGATEIANASNIGPSRIVGAAWAAVGLPLAAWLTWRGRLGLASLAASPYWLTYYLLFGLLDLVAPRGGVTARPTPP